MLDQALQGIRILDFTHLAAGPICSMLLGDMGADVIKIEAPQGDLARQLGPPWQNGESVTFLAMNRSKRSILVNLKHAEAPGLIHEMVAQADVVLESFRPGVMDRLGIGFEALRRSRPDLVYGAITAYGQNGPWRDKPGVDGVLQAVSGLMSITGEAGSGPSKAQTPTIDVVTGFLSVSAVLAALRRRDQSGEAQYLDLSMFSSAVMLQQTSLASYLATREVPERCGSAAPYAAPNEAFEASDGYMMVAAYQPPRWRALCELLEVPELEDDPRFVDVAARVANRDAMVAALNTRFRRQPRAFWLPKLEQADIICAPVNDYADVVASPQFQASGYEVPYEHPVAGELSMPGFALGDRPAPALRQRPPMAGEHTAAILAEFGVSPERYAQLRDTGVVHEQRVSSQSNA